MRWRRPRTFPTSPATLVSFNSLARDQHADERQRGEGRTIPSLRLDRRPEAAGAADRVNDAVSRVFRTGRGRGEARGIARPLTGALRAILLPQDREKSRRGPKLYYVDLTLNGLIFGSMYALMAVGLTLVYGLLRILHIAHAAVYAFGAFVDGDRRQCDRKHRARHFRRDGRIRAARRRDLSAALRAAARAIRPMSR